MNDDQVVIDHVTDLMWQQSGSDLTSKDKVEKYVNQINGAQYAGFSDWRLPTLEELASLIAYHTFKGIYLPGKKFDIAQVCCVGADKVEGSSHPWVVCFYPGGIVPGTKPEYYVRLVRSMTPNQ